MRIFHFTFRLLNEFDSTSWLVERLGYTSARRASFIVLQTGY